MGLGKKIYPSVTFVNVFSKKYFWQSGTLKICALKNKHSKDSWAPQFFFGKKSLLYSSDTSLCPSLIRQARECTYLIHDCTASSHTFQKEPALYTMHTNSRQLAEAFKGNSLEKIIPIHFLLLKKNEEKRIRRELKPLGKTVCYVRDFDTLRL